MAEQTEILTRQERKTATRRALKDAALRCFAERDWSGTQIAHVTEAAGVAKGTFYVHFADMDAVVAELLAELNAGLVEHMLPVWQGKRERDLAATLRETAGVFLDYWKENEVFVRAYAAKAAAGISVEELRSGINPQARDLMMATLEKLAEERAVRVAVRRPELIVQGLLAMWLRLGLQFLFNPDVTRKDVVDALVRMTTGIADAVLG